MSSRVTVTTYWYNDFCTFQIRRYHKDYDGPVHEHCLLFRYAMNANLRQPIDDHIGVTCYHPTPPYYHNSTSFQRAERADRAPTCL